jgi:hypothetical protein
MRRMVRTLAPRSIAGRSKAQGLDTPESAVHVVDLITASVHISERAYGCVRLRQTH